VSTLATPLPARRINWEVDLDLLLRGAATALVILFWRAPASWAWRCRWDSRP
jgi:hypothetical protein